MAEITPISEPSVQIFTRTVAAAVVTPITGMASVMIAPNFQIVDAQDANGNFDADALLGSYQNPSPTSTVTYALPDLEDGSDLQEDTVRIWAKIGGESFELDGPDDEAEVVDSAATDFSFDDPAPGQHTLTDTTQSFTDLGLDDLITSEDTQVVVRMTGADGLTHDFLVVDVPSATTLVIENALDVDVAPSAISPWNYLVVTNPTQFVVNATAEAATLRVDSASATLTVADSTGIDSNGDVVYTAIPAGNDGNSITIAHTHSGGAPAVTVTVVGAAITVTLDVGTHTATQVKSAVDAHPVASALVTVAVDDGSGTAGSKVATALAGGSHIIFEAVDAGSSGNALKIKYALADTDNPLAISYLDGNLVVTLENAVDVAVSTDTEIAAAVVGDTDASAVITATAHGGTGVPTAADLATLTLMDGGLDADSVTVDGGLLPNGNITAQLYVSYRSLRRVYSPLASLETTGNDPQLVEISDPNDIESLVGKVSVYNPLALMMYLHLVAAPRRTVYGLALDAVSDSEPDGTALAWARAASFLQGQQPYVLVPATQRPEIHDIWVAHSATMNGDDEGTVAGVLEVFTLLNHELPLTSPDVPIGNGEDLQDQVTATEFTASENFTLLGVQAGDVVVIDGVTTGTTATLQDGSVGFIIKQVKSGDSYTLDLKAVADGEADYVEPTWSGNKGYAIYRPGTALLVGGTYDKATIAQTIAERSQAMADYHIMPTFPSKCTVTVEGTAYSVPGYYLNASLSALIVSQSMSRSKVNQQILGIDGVRFANDFFTAAQLNLIQGGGTTTMVQKSANSPVTVRHCLTSDVSTTLKKHPTSAWQLDKLRRLYRNVARPFLGGTITPKYLNDLNVRLESVGTYQARHEELAGPPEILSLQQGDGTDYPVDAIVLSVRAKPLFVAESITFNMTFVET